jgi:hypothetical protein
MQSTVAAMILVFVYRCGGSVGVAIEPGAPTSRLIPGLCSPRDTCRRGDSVREPVKFVNPDMWIPGQARDDAELR